MQSRNADIHNALNLEPEVLGCNCCLLGHRQVVNLAHDGNRPIPAPCPSAATR